jgi:type II secretory pathway component GspD/PulD (secretin)
MKVRLFASLALAGMMLGIASADDRKKSDQAPETPPQLPAAVMPPPMVSAGQIRLPLARWVDEQNSQSFQDEITVPVTPVRHVVKTYTVADLVVPLPQAGYVADSPKVAVNTLEHELIKRITTNVAPKSWSSAGGKGSIDYFPIGMALVVNNTPTVQAAIEKYLDGLRQMLDLQVVTELVLVTVSDACFENSGLAASFYPTETAKAGATKVKLLTVDEATKLIRSAKEQFVGTTVLARPRITTLIGQPGRIKIAQTEHYLTELKMCAVEGQLVFLPKNEPHELGLDMTIEPNISADGKYIRLAVAGTSRELGVIPVPMTPVTIPINPVAEDGKKLEAVPFTQFIQTPKIISRNVAETITMPDGGVAMLYGGKAIIEETVKECAPMLADVPVLAELFTRERKTTTTNHLLVVVQSHVLKRETADNECAQCCATGDSKLGKLMADYAKACKTGKAEDARRLAMECLVIDPTCFGKK